FIEPFGKSQELVGTSCNTSMQWGRAPTTKPRQSSARLFSVPKEFGIVFSFCFVQSYAAAIVNESKVHNPGARSGGDLPGRLAAASGRRGRRLLCDDDQRLQLRGQSTQRHRRLRLDEQQ